MRVTRLHGLLAVFSVFVLLAGGCSTTNSSTFEQPALDSQAGDTHETAGFELNIQPETYYGGAKVEEFTLDTEEFEGGVMVTVRATGAENLKALYFDMDYDPASLRPMICEPTEAMGSSGEVIKLQYFKDRGTVHYGQAVIQPDGKPGYSGDGVVTTVLFKQEPALDLRTVSTPNNGTLSAQIIEDDISTNMTWWYANQGDFDQNNEVNAADIQQIAVHYFEAGPWTVNQNQNVIDGNGDGEINASDIQQIAVHYFETATEFHIFSSADAADYPDGGTDVLTVAYADGTVADPGGRRTYSIPMNDPGFGNLDPNNFYWIFSSDGDTLSTTESNVVGGDPTLRPLLSLASPDPATLPGDGTNPATGGSPFIVQTLTDYTFHLELQDSTDVTTDALTSYTVSDPAAGSISNTDAILNIPDGYEGTFNVTAVYDGNPNRSDTTIYMTVEGDPVEGLFIMPSTDTVWDSVTGTGADVNNPYVLGESGGFNDDHSATFTMVANEAQDGSGNPINVNDLTWMAYPPFVVTWTAAGSFQSNMFTSEYIFAQDSESNNSNSVFIVWQGLPDT